MSSECSVLLVIGVFFSTRFLFAPLLCERIHCSRDVRRFSEITKRACVSVLVQSRKRARARGKKKGKRKKDEGDGDW